MSTPPVWRVRPGYFLQPKRAGAPDNRPYTRLDGSASSADPADAPEVEVMACWTDASVASRTAVRICRTAVADSAVVDETVTLSATSLLAVCRDGGVPAGWLSGRLSTSSGAQVITDSV